MFKNLLVYHITYFWVTNLVNQFIIEVVPENLLIMRRIITLL